MHAGTDAVTIDGKHITCSIGPFNAPVSLNIKGARSDIVRSTTWSEVTVGALLIALLLCGCRGKPAGSIDTPYPSEVGWETAVAVLNSGEVTMATQLHSLEVILTMKNGSEITTVEPYIDAVFDEVQKCGEPCSEITLVTE
jgi:hypothetical protein